MIVEWLVSMGTAVAGWFADLFAPLDLPSWLTDGQSGLYGFLESASGIGVWVPWQVIGTVVAFLVTVYVAVFGFRLALFIWQRVPFFGGGG